MGGLFHILSLFLNSFNKFNNKTGALVLDPRFISLNVELRPTRTHKYLGMFWYYPSNLCRASTVSAHKVLIFIKAQKLYIWPRD